MGTDLTLLVVDGECPDLCFSHTMMRLERNSDLFDQVKTAGARADIIPASVRFLAYVAQHPDGGNHYGDIHEDCYGNRLTWVRAAELTAIRLRGAGPLTRAAWAYLRTIPDRRVVLFWH